MRKNNTCLAKLYLNSKCLFLEFPSLGCEPVEKSFLSELLFILDRKIRRTESEGRKMKEDEMKSLKELKKAKTKIGIYLK